MKRMIPRLIRRLTRLSVPEGDLVQFNVQTQGSVRCFIAKNDALDVFLRQRYGRDNLCLKVFRAKAVNLKKPMWEGIHITECTIIQNLFALEGMAPRVYDLTLVNDEYLAQVTDHIEPNGEVDRDEFERIMKKYNLGPVDPSRHRWKMPLHNYVGSQLVDFGGLHFLNAQKYRKGMIERTYYEEHRKPYQPIEELGIEGIRDIVHRVDVMKFDEVDFEDKSVLDLGCNIGAFCREAKKRGAKRVVGVDKEKAGAAHELSNWLGYWDIDYLKLALPGQFPEIQKKTGLAKFDVVLCLAVSGHTGGIDHHKADACGGILLFEGHRDTREKYEPVLQRYFNSVNFLGYTTDMGKRPTFRCE